MTTDDEPARIPYVPPELFELALQPPQDFEFREPLGPLDLTPEPNPFRNVAWRNELLAMTLRPPGLSQEYFEFLEDQAYVHLPNCPRLVDRHCDWCADEGVALTSEVLRRERAIKDLVPNIATIIKP